MTAATAPGGARGWAREGASRHAEQATKPHGNEGKTAKKASVPTREQRLGNRFYSPPSLAALPWLSCKTKLSGTVRHSKIQVRTLSAYSHSIVAGGLLVMSYATRLMPGTSATMRPEMRASTS